MLNTLLELYDKDEPIQNVPGAWHLQPQTIIYFYYELDDAEAERRELAQMFNRIGLRCNVRMEKLDRLDVRDMLEWVEEHRDGLDNFAIELTGGDDELLFAAGVCYARFLCPIYMRRSDGRYTSYPSNEEIDPGRGKFTVAQRLLLKDVTHNGYGHVGPNDVTPSLTRLADQLLDLQYHHHAAWSNLTTCIQQCSSHAADDALTILLDKRRCEQFNVSTAEGNLLPRLLRTGALTRIEASDDGIWITFPNMILRKCLIDFGVWLEIVIYKMLKSTGKFDDVQISFKVHWENETLENELDVIATAGMGLLIISCKTCEPDMRAIAELNVLAKRLGSTLTHQVLLAMPKLHENLDNVCARCDEMGIQLIDFRKHNLDELRSIFNRMGDNLRAGRYNT